MDMHHQCTLLAWVDGEDIKAVRCADGEERLIVDGVTIPLTCADIYPVQWVINYARGGKRTRKQLRAHWANIVADRFGLGAA